MFNGIMVALFVITLSVPSKIWFVKTKEYKNKSIILEFNAPEGEILFYELNQRDTVYSGNTLSIPIDNIGSSMTIVAKTKTSSVVVDLINTYKKQDIKVEEKQYSIGYILKTQQVNCYVENTFCKTIRFSSLPNEFQREFLKEIPNAFYGSFFYDGNLSVSGKLKIFDKGDLFPDIPFDGKYVFPLKAVEKEKIYSFELANGYQYTKNGKWIQTKDGIQNSIIIPRRDIQGTLLCEVEYHIGIMVFHYPFSIQIEKAIKEGLSITTEEKKIDFYEKEFFI